MQPLLNYLMLKCFILFLIFPNYLTQYVSSVKRNCTDSERSALLQLKASFDLNSCDSPFAYSKLCSWKPEGDCCFWDGVECDEDSGHVVGLDLSSSSLNGSIDSNNSLFHLLHLKKLNLSGNNFNLSDIPYAIGNLSKLSHLDLSFSGFSGQIPLQVLKLSQLNTLDLSWNDGLELHDPSLKSLAEKLVNVENLDLEGVNISSEIPHSLVNFSSLTLLSLSSCELHGEFPVEVFELPNLKILQVSYNPYLAGRLPQFNTSSSIESLRLVNTGFSGELPKSIGNLKSLSHLILDHCVFSGPIPSSLANLTQLTNLSLAKNGFSHGILSWLGKQTKLTTLNMRSTNSYGHIVPCLSNLTQLTHLDLSNNEFLDQIPYWFGNLSQLNYLNLASNQLFGPIPQSISSLVNLEFLDLQENHLNGTIGLQYFLNLKNLKSLRLSHNNLSLLTTTVKNATIPKFKMLKLDFCNLLKFPDFLSGQDELEYLNLSGNRIGGVIPKWIQGLSSLVGLELGSNILTGFEQPLVAHAWKNLRVLVVKSNRLQGSLPIPPASIYQYAVSNNLLTGEVSPLLCNLTSAIVLDLSNNMLSGTLPPCFGNLSKSIIVLNVRKNMLRGLVPQTCQKGSKLRMIDFSQNQFNGPVPRSMTDCNKLEILNLGSNQIKDTFPSWLGMFPRLKVLIPRHNRFHGPIGKPETKNYFPKLRVFDLSFNKFNGDLPSHHFQKWEAMKVVDAAKLRYLQANTSFREPNRHWVKAFYSYSITITNKGQELKYSKIQEFLVAIDLSSNRFEGCIPESIGIVKALQFLNLSNNFLSCSIPQSMANLTALESLDLSWNKLSGEIPQVLAQLTFLELFNVSHNQLMGLIPQGKQFATFENSSYVDNPGLCGIPLSNKCFSGDRSPPPPTSSSKNGQSRGFPLEFGWEVVLFGYGSGLVIGLILASNFNPVHFFKLKQLKQCFSLRCLKT